MAKRRKFLKFFKEYFGYDLPDNGLCFSKWHMRLHSEQLQLFDLMIPSGGDSDDLDKEGLDSAYWGSGLPVTYRKWERMYSFTPLRQTIVLLLAAMNDEL
jgi:hypothetical protein